MKEHEQADIVRKLVDLIEKSVPKAQAINKYGGTLYTLKPDKKEGQFCGIFQYENHVQLAFSQGALLNDPDRQLKGHGKLRRHINIQDGQDIIETSLKKLLREAAKYSKGDSK